MNQTCPQFINLESDHYYIKQLFDEEKPKAVNLFYKLITKKIMNKIDKLLKEPQFSYGKREPDLVIFYHGKWIINAQIREQIRNIVIDLRHQLYVNLMIERKEYLYIDDTYFEEELSFKVYKRTTKGKGNYIAQVTDETLLNNYIFQKEKRFDSY